MSDEKTTAGETLANLYNAAALRSVGKPMFELDLQSVRWGTDGGSVLRVWIEDGMFHLKTEWPSDKFRSTTVEDALELVARWLADPRCRWLSSPIPTHDPAVPVAPPAIKADGALYAAIRAALVTAHNTDDYRVEVKFSGSGESMTLGVTVQDRVGTATVASFCTPACSTADEALIAIARLVVQRTADQADARNRLMRLLHISEST